MIQLPFRSGGLSAFKKIMLPDLRGKETKQMRIAAQRADQALCLPCYSTIVARFFAVEEELIDVLLERPA